MPAIASMETLQEAESAIREAQRRQDAAAVLEAMKVHGPRIGWKNVAHMVFYLKSAEELKRGRSRE